VNEGENGKVKTEKVVKHQGVKFDDKWEVGKVYNSKWLEERTRTKECPLNPVYKADDVTKVSMALLPSSPFVASC
jgi:hypothetical protein